MHARSLLALLCAFLCVPGERLGVSPDDDLEEALKDVPELPSCNDGTMTLSGTYKVTTQFNFESCTIRGALGTKVDLGKRLHFSQDLRLEGNITFSGHSLFGEEEPRCLDVEGSMAFAGDIAFHDCGRNHTPDGGAAWVGHNITFEAGQVHFEGCASEYGGCLYAGEYVTMQNGTASFHDAWASDSGGAIYASIGFIQTGGAVTFRDCYADSSGGAIYVKQKVAQSGGSAIFDNCSAHSGGGGGVYIDKQSGTGAFVQNGGSMTFSNCKAPLGNGGAMIAGKLVQSAGSLTFVKCTSRSAGALQLWSSLLQSGGEMTFQGNSCRKGECQGGAVHSWKSWVQNGGRTVFSSSTAKEGGSLFLAGSFVQSGGETIFQHSMAQSSGGALRVNNLLQKGGTLRFVNCSARMRGGAACLDGALKQRSGQMLFDTCSAGSAGGALYIKSRRYKVRIASKSADTLIFRNCFSSLIGGAIHAWGLQLKGNSFFENCSSGSGGAVFDWASSRLEGTVFSNVSKPVVISKEKLSVKNVTIVRSSAEFVAAAVSVQNLNCSLGWEGFMDPTFSRRVGCSRCTTGRVQVDTSRFTIKDNSRPKDGEFNHTQQDEDFPVLCLPCPSLSEECGGGYLRMQEGVMVDVSNISLHIHCPNPQACPGGELPAGNVSMCASGYTGTACTKCEPGTHARSDGYVFKCDKCPTDFKKQVLQTAGYISKDIIIFAISAFSVLGAAAKKKSSSVVINQLMSFGAVGGIVLVALAETEAFDQLKADMATLMETFESFIELPDLGSGSVGTSFECLLGAFDLPQTLLAAHAAKFVVPSLLVLGLSLATDVWLALVVGTNCFLPKFVASLGKYMICYHVISERDGGSSICEFLDEARGVTQVAVVSALAFCFVAGPGLWVKVSLEKAEPQPKHVLYLTSSYKPSYALFETERLLRKMLLMLASTVLPVSVSAALQMACVNVIILSALAAHLYLHPYAVRYWNWVEGCLLGVAMVMVCLASCLISNETYWGHSQETQRLLVLTTISLAAVTSLAMTLLLAKEIFMERFRKRGYDEE